MMRVIFALIILFEAFTFFNRGGGPLLSHFALTGTTVLILLYCLIAKPRFRLQLEFPQIAFLIFFSFFVVSLFYSVTPEFGLAELLLFANAAALFVVFSSLKIEEEDLRWFIGVLILITAVDTLIGFYIYTATPFPRLVGTFGNLGQQYVSFANSYANFLILVLPLAFAWLFGAHKNMPMVLVSTAVCAVLTTGLLLSFSRGAWIAFAGAAVLTGIWIVISRPRISHEKRAKGVTQKIIITLLLTTLLVFGIQAIRSRNFETNSIVKKILFQADEKEASAVERIQLWRGAKDLIQDNPVFGSGVLSFKFLYPQQQTVFGINMDHPHNIFLKIGVENGIFAAAFFTLFLLSMFFVTLKFFINYPRHIALALGFGAAAALAHNLVDFNFISSNFTLFIIFLGVLFSVTRGEENRFNRGRFMLVIILLAALFLTGLGIHEGVYNFSFKRGREAFVQGNTDEAVVLLEKSKNLYFQRDLINYLAAAYNEKYKTTKDKIWREQEKELLARAAVNTKDAAIFSKLGEIYEGEYKIKTAAEFYAKAILLDPTNRLKYYFQLLNLQRRFGPKVDAATRAKAKDLLAEYASSIYINAHMTVLTDNPEYASKLYMFFGMKREKLEFDKAWQAEVQKFSEKYGSINAPIL